MTYSPHTDADRAQMLAAVGVESVEDLFADIPASVRASAWDVPPPLAEQEVRAELARLASRNRIPEVSFLGAGVYRHLIPSVVGEVIGRPEFATAYTPYQPEVSQGTLQSIYEFQSLICELTGMEVATASHYDGATATAEAALMACRLTRRSTIAVSAGVNPDYRRVLETYCSGPGIEVVTVPIDLAEGWDRHDLAGGRVGSARGRRRLPRGGTAELLWPARADARARRRGACRRRPARGGRGADVARAAGGARGLWRRPRGRGGPAARHPGQLRWAVCRAHGGADGVGAADARPAGRRDARHRRSQGLRAHSPGPRAAHPPREGRIQHLHEPGAHGARGHCLPLGRRSAGPARGRRAVD